MKTTTDTTPARSTFEAIAEMVRALSVAAINGGRRVFARTRQTIQESPLSVRVRSGWLDVRSHKLLEPEEFEIRMCYGGPAVRIRGELNEQREVETARIEWQDWGTPWTPELLDGDDKETLLEFCREFYFGE